MSAEWTTKQGKRRVRVEPPTLEEAIFAAQGVTDDPQQQADFAADLTGQPAETILAQIRRKRARRPAPAAWWRFRRAAASAPSSSSASRRVIRRA